MGYYITVESVFFASKLQVEKLKPKGAKQFSPYGSTNHCENWRRDLLLLSRHSWEPQMPASALSMLYCVFHLGLSCAQGCTQPGVVQAGRPKCFGEEEGYFDELGKDW